jgi:hypothetical protein
VFKTEKEMLLAFVECKFAGIYCQTEYEDDRTADLDSLSFEFEDVK